MSLKNLILFVNSIGLILDIIGAWLIAYEVVNQYRGFKIQLNNIPSANVQSTLSPVAADHRDLKVYEHHKYQKMKWGLGLLTLGFIFQLSTNLYQIIF